MKKNRMIVAAAFLIMSTDLFAASAASPTSKEDISRGNVSLISSMEIPSEDLTSSKRSGAGLSAEDLMAMDPATLLDTLEANRAAGDMDATYNIGVLFLGKKGFSRNLGKAISYLTEAAVAGHVLAQFYLGHIYAVDMPKADDAIQWFRRAAENGHAKAQFNMWYILKDSDQPNALKWLRGSAQGGFPTAQFNLPLFSAQMGRSMDDVEAMKWYRCAAEAGIAEAQVNLGNAYAEGLGVPVDDCEAVKWYTAAAQKGQAIAQYYLGKAYANGRGVAQDKRRGLKLIIDSAKSGLAEAKLTLGMLLANM